MHTVTNGHGWMEMDGILYSVKVEHPRMEGRTNAAPSAEMPVHKKSNVAFDLLPIDNSHATPLVHVHTDSS